MTGALEILPAALRTPVAWKNGGGVTREIAALPRGAGLNHFEWRVSTAEVRSAGAACYSDRGGMEPKRP